MHVAAIVKRKGADVVTTSPDATVSAVAALLAHHRIGAVLVAGPDGQPVGILSERDIVRAVAASGPAALKAAARTLMTSELITCTPDDTDSGLMALMTERRIRHLPVIEDGRLAGLVSIGDVVKARLDATEVEVESLRGYVAGVR